LAADFLAADFLAAVFLAAVFLAAAFAVGFFAVLFVVLAFFALDAVAGVSATARRAALWAAERLDALPLARPEPEAADARLADAAFRAEPVLAVAVLAVDFLAAGTDPLLAAVLLAGAFGIARSLHVWMWSDHHHMVRRGYACRPRPSTTSTELFEHPSRAGAGATRAGTRVWPDAPVL
jgi:hypothetical protein